MQQYLDQQPNHLQWPDTAKGIGIVLVVMGHGMFPQHSLIDSFHMPLFFVLAGLFVNADKYSINEYVSKRFVRVMIPYFIFAVGVGLYAMSMGMQEVVHHIKSLWFLYTIFFASSLYYIIRRYIVLKWCNLLFAAMVFILSSCSTGGGDFSELRAFVTRILYAVVFMHVGWLYKRFRLDINTHWYVLLLLFLGFLFCNVLIIRRYELLNISYFSGTLFQLPVYLLVASTLSGSYLVMYVSQKIEDTSTLQYIGRNSLAIYAFHIPLIWKLNNQIGTLPHYDQITYKLLYAALEYCIVFAVVMTLIWALRKTLPIKYYKYIGISK